MPGPLITVGQPLLQGAIPRPAVPSSARCGGKVLQGRAFTLLSLVIGMGLAVLLGQVSYSNNEPSITLASHMATAPRFQSWQRWAGPHVPAAALTSTSLRSPSLKNLKSKHVIRSSIPGTSEAELETWKEASWKEILTPPPSITIPEELPDSRENLLGRSLNVLKSKPVIMSSIPAASEVATQTEVPTKPPITIQKELPDSREVSREALKQQLPIQDKQTDSKKLPTQAEIRSELDAINYGFDELKRGVREAEKSKEGDQDIADGPQVPQAPLQEASQLPTKDLQRPSPLTQFIKAGMNVIQSGWSKFRAQGPKKKLLALCKKVQPNGIMAISTERDQIKTLVTKLTSLNPTKEPALAFEKQKGHWKMLYTDWPEQQGKLGPFTGEVFQHVDPLSQGGSISSMLEIGSSIKVSSELVAKQEVFDENTWRVNFETLAIKVAGLVLPRQRFSPYDKVWLWRYLYLDDNLRVWRAFKLGDLKPGEDRDYLFVTVRE